MHLKNMSFVPVLLFRFNSKVDEIMSFARSGTFPYEKIKIAKKMAATSHVLLFTLWIKCLLRGLGACLVYLYLIVEIQKFDNIGHMCFVRVVRFCGDPK